MTSARRIRCRAEWLAPLVVLLLAAVSLAGLVFADSIVATVQVGTEPVGVGANPTTNRIYVADRADNLVSVIDGTSNTVTATVNVGNKPQSLGVNPVTNRVYVANYGDNTVSVIDGNTNTVLGSAIAVRALPTGVAVNPTKNRIYVSNSGDSTVSVIDGNSNTVVGGPITVGAVPLGIAVNPTTDRIYVTNDAAASVSVIDGNTNTVLGAPVPVGGSPQGVAVNQAANRIYVVNNGANSVSVIDGNTNTVTATVGVGKGPQRAAVNPTTNRVYVSNSADGSVSVISGSDNTLLGAPLAVGTFPTDLAVNPTTDLVYVTDTDGGNVLVIENVRLGDQPGPRLVVTLPVAPGTPPPVPPSAGQQATPTPTPRPRFPVDPIGPGLPPGITVPVVTLTPTPGPAIETLTLHISNEITSTHDWGETNTDSLSCTGLGGGLSDVGTAHSDAAVEGPEVGGIVEVGYDTYWDPGTQPAPCWTWDNGAYRGAFKFAITQDVQNIFGPSLFGQQEFLLTAKLHFNVSYPPEDAGDQCPARVDLQTASIDWTGGVSDLIPGDELTSVDITDQTLNEVDVTSTVQRWLVYDDQGDNGFVIRQPFEVHSSNDSPSGSVNCHAFFNDITLDLQYTH